MPTVIISEATRRLIDAQVLPGYDLRQTAILLGVDRWSLAVDDDVAARIEAERLPGETDDDVVMRLARAATGRRLD